MKVTNKQLLQYVQTTPGVSVTALAKHFDVTTKTIHLHLKTLISQGKIEKKGTIPHTRYYPLSSQASGSVHFPPHLQRTLDSQRYQISKTGQELIGSQGFVTWCGKRGLDPQSAAERRLNHILFIDSVTTPYGINATGKLHDYGKEILTHLWYSSIYALPEFGKTRAGTLMEIAKTHPSRSIFDQLSSIARPYYQRIIDQYSIGAVCFAQPTAKRPLQIMKHLEQVLGQDIPILPLYKLPGYFPAQKTLKKREDRIANAKASFDLEYDSPGGYDNVLIIDDAVGSGATLVEIGRKILARGLGKSVYALSVTGTANGIFDQVKQFEVLSGV